MSLLIICSKIFLKSLNNDEFLQNSNQNKIHNSKETFCGGFYIASFPEKDVQVIENSEAFPASCAHNDCSSLPSMKPEIIYLYPLKDTKNLELNNLAFVFQQGLKFVIQKKNIE